jgi:transcriptional regulator with XRE-family HTH domain
VTGSARRPPPHPAPAGAGVHLRAWRERRRLSQMALALDADVSARHLSYVETGRAQPSREMLLRLADSLEVPLRERNALLTAAGYAPVYPQHALDDPHLAAARRAVEWIVAAHAPNPALALDRHWNMVSANRMIAPLLTGVDAALLAPPVNVLRLTLHPRGLAPRIANFGIWRAHMMERISQQVARTADAALAALRDELASMPVPNHAQPPSGPPLDGLVMPLELRTSAGMLRLMSTTTIFGSPMDVTLSELAIESLFPADEATAAALRRMDPGVA